MIYDKKEIFLFNLISKNNFLPVKSSKITTPIAHTSTFSL